VITSKFDEIVYQPQIIFAAHTELLIL